APEVGGLDLFVGHDTNVTALAAALGVTLKASDYADGDVPPGGALVFMSVVDSTGRRSVRVYYQTQSLDALRRLDDRVSRSEIVLGGAGRRGRGAIPLDAFRRRLSAALEAHANALD
ncbi:MAG TPA: histidine-type phosphatase, partial [Caulobacter sp.]|nr:histidine-type phosphatase [Caulobacter sp.]